MFKRTIISLFAVFCGIKSEALAFSKENFLKAIRHVESGDNHAAIGSHGERGAYQFKHSVWKQHTENSFVNAHEVEISNEIASQHYDWIVKTLSKSGKRVNARNLALAWNAGIGNAIRNNVSRHNKDYANRVENLLLEFEKQDILAKIPQISCL